MAKKKNKKTKSKPAKAKKTSKKEKLRQKKLVKQKTKTKSQPKKIRPKSKKTTVSKTKKSSSSLREKTIDKIKKDLLSQRETLLKEAEEALNTLPGEINFPDMGDQATAETDRNFMLRLRDRERMLLKKIDEAIERIENNTFGICQECGKEIGTKRLEARPVTALCIDCKTQQEEEERIAEGA